MSRIDELDPSYLQGIVRDEPDKPPDLGFWGQAKDVGIKVLDPVLGAARTVSTVAREAEADPHGMAHDVDRWLGRQQTALQEEGLSPQQKAIDDSKWFNAGPDDRSAWDHPFKKLGSEALGLVAPLAATAVTGGGAAAGLAVGALNSGTALANMHDKIDQAPLAELMKLPTFADLYRNNGGDDLDAREQLIKQSTDWVSVATNAGANMLSFGALGHAMGRAATDSGLVNFLGRAAFGGTEGAVLGASQGVTGELVQQKANVAQGKQSDVDFAALVRAGEEAVPGMAAPLSAMHGFRRGPRDTADTGKGTGEQYGPHITDEQLATNQKAPLNADVTSTLDKQVNPETAIDTGSPINPDQRLMAQQQSRGYASLEADRQYGPPNQYGPHLPSEQHGPVEHYGPQLPEQQGPPNQYGPHLPGPGPRPGGVWGNAQPELWRNVPPPEQYGPRLPTEQHGPPAPPEVYGPHLPTEKYGPYAPSQPPRPGGGEAPGGGPYRGPPTAPGAPSFPDTGRPGLPTPGEFGGEPEAQARPPPARTIHVTPQDAQKIRAGVRLVPGAGNTYTLEARGGQSIGRIAAHGQAQGLVPIGFGNDGLVVGKGRPLGSARPAVMDPALQQGAVPGTGPVQVGRVSPPAAPPVSLETYTGPSAPELHATPLRPGRAMWRSNVGVHEVEILSDPEGQGHAQQQRGHYKVRYTITDKAGRTYTDEAWVRTDELTQGGGTGRPEGGGGGPTEPPGGGGGGRPVRGSLQDQLGDVASHIFAPTNEPLTEEVERTIRGGVATVEPPSLRQGWADYLQSLLDARLEAPGQVPALFGRDFPRAMHEHFDAHEWGVLVDAARDSPQEVIDIIREPPLGGGRNPVLAELEYRRVGRANRGGQAERRALGRNRAQRGGFEPIVRTELPPAPYDEHVRARGRAEEPQPPAPAAQRAHLTVREAEEQAQRNLEVQQRERQRQAVSADDRRQAEAERQRATAEATGEDTAEAELTRRGGRQVIAERLTPDEADLASDIVRHNQRVQQWATLSGDERVRARRAYSALGPRLDRVNEARQARGLDPATTEDIAHPPTERRAETPEQRFNRLRDQLEVERTRTSVDEDQMTDRPKRRITEEDRQKRMDDIVAQMVHINDDLRATGKRQLPIPIADYDRHVSQRGVPHLGIERDRPRSQEQEEHETAKAITAIVVPPRGKLVGGRMMPQIVHDIWNKLSQSEAGQAYQKKLAAADRARVRKEGRALVEPSQGGFWTSVYRKYWTNLSKTEKGKLLAEAERGMGKTMSPTDLREAVIKEVEALHVAARERAAKTGLKPHDIRTKKIPGMRQKELPPEIPTEEEALERLEDVQRRVGSQQRKEKQREGEYTAREKAVNDTLQTAVKKRFGTPGRFSDLVTQLFNHSLVRPPPRELRENPSLFQRAGRAAKWMGMPDVNLLTKHAELAKEKGEPKRAEDLARAAELARAELAAGTAAETERVKLTPAQLRAEQLEDAALEGGKRYSLAERLRRAKQEGREPDVERLEGEPEEEDTGRTSPSQRRANIYAEKMSDYFKIKDLQLKEAKQLRKFVDHLVEQLAKNLEGARKEGGYSGVGIKWHLPQARDREKGLPTGYRGAQQESAKTVSVRKKYSAGEADEKFGAYSFTADLLNLQDALDFAIKGVDSLGKGGGTRLTPGSGQLRWNPKTGRRGKVVASGEGISTRQAEVQRYMSPLNRMLLDFSWRIDKAMQGDWEALKNVRTAQTEEFARAARGESLEAREERQHSAIEAGEQSATVGDIATEDIGRGRGADAIQTTAAGIIDKRVEVTLARAWAKERQAGRLQNVSFDAYKDQHFAELKARTARDFPLPPVIQTPKGPMRAQQRAPERVSDVSTFKYDPNRRGIINVMSDVAEDLPPIPKAEQAVWDKAPIRSINELFAPYVSGARGRGEASFAVDEAGHIHDVGTHEDHVQSMEGARNPSGDPDSYEYGDEYHELSRPYVHITKFSHEGLTEFGINHSSSLTRAQERTVRSVIAEANKSRRDGEKVNVSYQGWTDYRGVGPTHDAKGLPIEREQTPAVRDAHEDLGLPGTPRDPLISAPETTTAALDRVKGMIRDGTAGELPEKYINDEFLDQLARITQGTEVYHAPYAVVAGPKAARGGSWAEYLPFHDRVILSNDVTPDHYARSVIHETVHAATEGRLNADPVFAKDVNDLVAEATAHAERQGLKAGSGDLYGLTNPHEYLTESVSNPKFRDFLKSIDTDKPGIKGPSNLLQATYRAIRNTFSRVMGFFHGNTALDVLYHDQSTVLGRTDALIKRTMADIERQGREHRMPTLPAEQARHADGRYFARGIGANEFIKNAYGETQAWGKDVADRAKYAWDTKSKVRARGLDLMTPYDQTKISHRPEFRSRMEKAFDTIEKVFAEGNKLRDQDKRELDGAARIFRSWSKGNRQRAAEAMIDESNHGFFADRDLNQKGNEHFSDTLENAQAKEEHSTQQAEYKYLASHLPHYDEFRSAIHNFSARREEQLRKERIRDLVRYGSLLPENLDNATREKVSEAVRYWVDTKPERLPAVPGKGKASERFENMRETLERVPDKALIKQHLDVDNPDVLARIKEIRATPQMAHIPGPYVPFTRQGKFAVSGNIDIPKPANAILLEGDINHATGVPAGNDRYVFKTEAEARAFEREVTRKLGVKQLKEGSGPIDIDVGTGRRAEVPEKMEEGDDPQRFQLARGKKLQELKDAGANIEQHYAVQFQKKVLYYAPTEFDAKKITDDLREHYGSSIKITEPKDVFARDGRQNEQFVNTAMQKQIDSLRQSGAFKRLDTHEQAAVIDRLTSAAAAQTMNRGLKQRYLPRGYVKGASTNILGSMDEYSSYSSRYLAKLKHQAELMDNTEAVKDWLKDNEHLKDVLAEQRVYNAMMHRLHSPTENPRDNMVNRAVDRALKWTMLDKLPGVGYFVANATDAVAVGLPLMAGRHGMIRAIGMMGGMYRLSRKLRAVGSGLHDLVEAIKAGTDMTDYEKQIMRAVEGEPDAERMEGLFKHAFERAMFDRSANLEYQNTYMLNKSVIDKVGDYGTGIFQGVNTAIEAVNRFVTLGTAYRLEFNRLAKKAGEGADLSVNGEIHQKAVQYAMNIGHEANGVYANFNTPEMFNKGPLAKLIFQFKKYPQRIMMNYIRAGQGAIGLLKGERTEENIERAKQLGYMLATQGILAGTLGMPTEMFSMPLNALYMAGISKYNWDDAQNGYRQWAAEHFGKEGGGILAHGLLRYLTGTAIDQRLGQDSLLTFGSPGSPKSNDLKAAVANFILGATGGSAFQKLTGIQQLAAAGHAYMDGADDVALKHLGESARNLSPLRFVTDIITAANRSTPQGTETYAGRPMMKPYSTGEQVMRSIGLQPAREAEAGDERRSLQRERQVILDQKKSYTDEFVQSPTGAQRERVWARVQAWNAAHPGVPPLTRSDLLKAAGTRAKAEKAPTSMLGLPSDKTMQALQRRGSVYLTGE